MTVYHLINTEMDRHTTLISCWNSKEEKLLKLIDRSSANKNYIICVNDPNLRLRYENLKLTNTKFANSELYLYDSIRLDKCRTILGSEHNDIFSFFSSNCYSLILQSHRLSFGNEYLPDLTIRLEESFMQWVEFLRTHKVTNVLFSQPAHTGSDYILKMATKYLNLRYTELYSTLDRPLFFIYETNQKGAYKLFRESIALFDHQLSKKFSASEAITSFIHTSIKDSNNIIRRRKIQTSAHGNLTVKYYMHSEPECTINPGGSPFFSNHRVIQLLDYILPQEIRLIVRDHPVMKSGKKTLGWQSKGQSSSDTYRTSIFWQSIQRSNRIKIESNITLEESLSNCDGVITVNGDIQHEAACLNIPCLILGKKIIQSDGVKKFKIFALKDIGEFINSIQYEEWSNLNYQLHMTEYIKLLARNLFPMSTNFYRPMNEKDMLIDKDCILSTAYFIKSLAEA